MIGGRDRACPRCGAELCTYNPGVFCWPCTVPGYAWHFSQIIGDWVLIPTVRVEDEWQPEPGDVLMASVFQPEPRRPKVDNWDKWRRIEETVRV